MKATILEKNHVNITLLFNILPAGWAIFLRSLCILTLNTVAMELQNELCGIDFGKWLYSDKKLASIH
jgi:hypothetical protein